jgi:hypothetical protein
MRSRPATRAVRGARKSEPIDHPAKKQRYTEKNKHPQSRASEGVPAPCCHVSFSGWCPRIGRSLKRKSPAIDVAEPSRRESGGWGAWGVPRPPPQPPAPPLIPPEHRLDDLDHVAGLIAAAMIASMTAAVESGDLAADAGDGANRDRGEPCGSSPPTPPYIRVRIRRFGRLNGPVDCEGR